MGNQVSNIIRIIIVSGDWRENIGKIKSEVRHSCRLAGVGLKSSVILGSSLLHSWLILGPVHRGIVTGYCCMLK